LHLVQKQQHELIYLYHLVILLSYVRLDQIYEDQHQDLLTRHSALQLL
jgi:hypothetical protein